MTLKKLLKNFGTVGYGTYGMDWARVEILVCHLLALWQDPLALLKSVKVVVTQLGLTLCNPWTIATRLFCPWDLPGKNTRVGSHSLLKGIFWTQRSNPGLLHCRWILYHLSHQGSPRILKRVACPFSRGSSQPKDQTRVSCTAGGFFTIWATREALLL